MPDGRDSGRQDDVALKLHAGDALQPGEAGPH